MPDGIRRALLALLLASLALVSAATSAAAHVELISTTPAPGSAVDEPPAEVALSFNGDLKPIGVAIQATDAAGAELASAPPSVSGSRIVLRVAPATVGGQVRVVWRVVGHDGHQMQGTFGYAVGGLPSLSAAAAPAPAPEPGDGPWVVAGLGGGVAAAVAAGAFVLLRRRRAVMGS